MNKPHDRIYLQDWPGSRSHDATWCADQINDDDLEYLLATPEREAAPELYKRLDDAERALSSLHIDALGNDPANGYPYLEELLHYVRVTLAKARGEHNGS